MKLKEMPSKKLKRIDNLLVGTVAEEYLPFALVENKIFIELIKELEPCYSLPSRKTFTNKVAVDRYAELKQIISTSLDSSNYVAITADKWTSLATQGYLSVTAHYIELRSFKLRSAVLCTKDVPGSHTGEAISEAIKSVIREWNIEDKVFAKVSDNANVIQPGCH